MQYLIHKFSNLFTRKSIPPPDFKDLTIHDKPDDQLYRYIVDRTKSGRHGIYIYSDPKQNVHLKVENLKHPYNQFHSYIVEKSQVGPKGTYIYSDPKCKIHFHLQKC